QAAKSNFALPGTGGGAGIHRRRAERAQAGAEDLGGDANPGEPGVVHQQQWEGRAHRALCDAGATGYICAEGKRSRGSGRQEGATQDELAANDLALIKAQAEVARLSAAKQEFERSVKLDTDQTPLRLQQVQNEVAALEEKVRQGRITAPADGTLYSLGRSAESTPLKAGDYVKVGDLLAEMADLHKVRVRAFIDEPELGALEPNQPVKITWDALPSKTWTGKTETVPKQVVPHQNRSVGELLCAVNNDNLELLPNINVNVRINSRERIGVLSVPRGAVEADGGRRYVF